MITDSLGTQGRRVKRWASNLGLICGNCGAAIMLNEPNS